MADRELTDEIAADSPPPPYAGDVEAGGSSPTDPPPSLRETLEAAAREVEQPELADAPAAGDRPRGPDGKFIPKDAAIGAPDQPSPTATPDTPSAPSTAPLGPPPGWAVEAKAAFSKLPPAVQQAVVKREQEVSAGFAKYATQQKELEQVIGPRRQHYASEGVSDTQAINNLWTWFEALKNSPQNSFPALAQMFGYDLSTVTPNAAADSSYQTNPEVVALKAELAQLRGTVGQVAGTFEQQQTEARRAELASFAKDKPHFEAVRVTMGRLMQAGLAQSLDDAYQQAVKLSPEASAAIAADKQKADAEAALRGRPGSQRRAAVSVRGSSPNGAAGAPVPTSIRDSLREGFASARSG